MKTIRIYFSEPSNFDFFRVKLIKTAIWHWWCVISWKFRGADYLKSFQRAFYWQQRYKSKMSLCESLSWFANESLQSPQKIINTPALTNENPLTPTVPYACLHSTLNWQLSITRLENDRSVQKLDFKLLSCDAKKEMFDPWWAFVRYTTIREFGS